MSDPIIRTQQLSKRFVVADKEPGVLGGLRHLFARKTRDIDAVREASFELNRGEIVGFLGPNGAGKTTTLKMLTGLIHPSAGEVSVCGHVPFQREPAFLRRITLVMGNKQQLIWDLPALDSLRINAAVYEIDDGDAKSRIHELAEMLELSDQLTQPVRKLSLGQRMKAELLASLLHEPDVLFLDEPTLGLDVNAQVTIRRFLQEYNARTKATVLLTSHYMADITALCPRVLLINDGQLMYDGALEALLDRHGTGREVTVDLREAVDAARLARLGEVMSHDGMCVRFRAPKGEVPQLISAVLDELDVVDLSVQEPSVEEIIGDLFRRSSAEAEDEGQGDADVDGGAP